MNRVACVEAVFLLFCIVARNKAQPTSTYCSIRDCCTRGQSQGAESNDFQVKRQAGDSLACPHGRNNMNVSYFSFLLFSFPLTDTSTSSFNSPLYSVSLLPSFYQNPPLLIQSTLTLP